MIYHGRHRLLIEAQQGSERMNRKAL